MGEANREKAKYHATLFGENKSFKSVS